MNDKTYIKRCFTLALRGGKEVKSNPMVGAVLVHNSKIIGEGYHKKYGEGHAEVECLNSVLPVNASLIPASTLYVSLEPCCHSGKTPPCTDLILRHGIKNVVISILDPTAKVNGKGVENLRRNGVNVMTGILENEGEAIIKPFKSIIQKKRPYVLLKIAKSYDNFIGKKGETLRITNKLSNIYTHKIRSEVDSILVGSNTVIVDNPSLTTRNYPGSNPLRIVIDRNQKITSDSKIFNNEACTLYYTNGQRSLNSVIRQIDIAGKEDQLGFILKDLLEKEIYSVLIEGGRTIMESFLKHNYWDRAIILTSVNKLTKGIKAPNIQGKLLNKFIIDSDNISIIENTNC